VGPGGVFEGIMREPGSSSRSATAYRLYECFIDGPSASPRRGDGIGLTKAGKGVKIMVLVDARGLPVAVETTSAGPTKQAGAAAV